MSEPPKEELKIKDLLIKLQVLSNGLVEERKKSQNYLDRIKEYEDSLQKKDAEIVELTKEKFDLKSKLTLEKSKQAPNKKNDSYFSSILNKITQKPVDESKMTKLEEKINQQSFEIKDLSQRLVAEKENYDQQKIKYQTLLTVQSQELTKLKEELEKATKQVPTTNVAVASQQDKIETLKKQFSIERDKERDQYEKNITSLTNELKEVKAKNEELTKTITSKDEELFVKKIENETMKTQITKLNNDLHDKQLSPRTFQVERIKESIGIKNKSVMTITFQLNKNKKRCEVIFKRMRNGKLVEENVNILEIYTFKVNEKKPEYIEIEFKVSLII